MGYNLRTVLESCRLLARAGFREQMSVYYSFNVIDERPETIRQTVAYRRELERIFGADKVEPAIFFIGLQPHTHLEQYGFEQGLIRPGYDPMSMMPWTARKLLWNPEPMGSTFGRTAIDLLERDYGCAPLEQALRAPVEGRRALATAVRLMPRGIFGSIVTGSTYSRGLPWSAEVVTLATLAYSASKSVN
jgi:hypothetical protein